MIERELKVIYYKTQDHDIDYALKRKLNPPYFDADGIQYLKEIQNNLQGMSGTGLSKNRS